MEDAATAEISRSQIWQWLRHDRIGGDDVRRVTDEELRAAVDRMTRVALATVTADEKH